MTKLICKLPYHNCDLLCNRNRNFDIPFQILPGNLVAQPRIYEEIKDVLEGIKVIDPELAKNATPDPRASGFYDEIPEITTLPAITKQRTGSSGSTDSNDSSGRRTPREADIEKRPSRTKAIADKVLRRRSFVKEKPSIAPKATLESETSEGFVLVPPSDQIPNKRNSIDLSLPVNENKGSILQIVRNITKHRTIKRRGSAPKSRRK